MITFPFLFFFCFFAVFIFFIYIRIVYKLIKSLQLWFKLYHFIIFFIANIHKRCIFTYILPKAFFLQISNKFINHKNSSIMHFFISHCLLSCSPSPSLSLIIVFWMNRTLGFWTGLFLIKKYSGIVCFCFPFFQFKATILFPLKTSNLSFKFCIDSNVITITLKELIISS